MFDLIMYGLMALVVVGSVIVYRRMHRTPLPVPLVTVVDASERPLPECFACAEAGVWEVPAAMVMDGEGIDTDGLSIVIRRALCAACYAQQRRQWQQEPQTHVARWTDAGYQPQFSAWRRW